MPRNKPSRAKSQHREHCSIADPSEVPSDSPDSRIRFLRVDSSHRFSPSFRAGSYLQLPQAQRALHRRRHRGARRRRVGCLFSLPPSAAPRRSRLLRRILFPEFRGNLPLVNRVQCLQPYVLSSRRPTTITLPPLLNATDATVLPIPLVPPITISFLPRKSDSIALSASADTSRTDKANFRLILSLPTHGTFLAPASWPNGCRAVLPTAIQNAASGSNVTLKPEVEGSDIRVPQLEIEFRHQLNQTRVNSRRPSVKNASEVCGVRISVHASAAGDGIKIGMIEEIEKLNAKLEFSGLGHLTVLVNRKIKIV